MKETYAHSDGWRTGREKSFETPQACSHNGDSTPPHVNGKARAESDMLPLTGLCIAVTGDLEDPNRWQVESKVRELGGIVSSGVSRDTGYLIVGEHPGVALTEAQRLGTRLVCQKDFLRYYHSVLASKKLRDLAGKL